MRIALAVSGTIGLIALALLATRHGFAPVTMPQLATLERVSEPRSSDPASLTPSRGPRDTRRQPAQPGPSGPRPALTPTSTRLRVGTPPGVPRIRVVAGLTPYTAQTRYMSLPAYLRVLIHEQTGRWVTYQEAAQMVKTGRAPVDVEGQTY